MELPPGIIVAIIFGVILKILFWAVVCRNCHRHYHWQSNPTLTPSPRKKGKKFRLTRVRMTEDDLNAHLTKHPELQFVEDETVSNQEAAAMPLPLLQGHQACGQGNDQMALVVVQQQQNATLLVVAPPPQSHEARSTYVTAYPGMAQAVSAMQPQIQHM